MNWFNFIFVICGLLVLTSEWFWKAFGNIILFIATEDMLRDEGKAEQKRLRKAFKPVEACGWALALLILWMPVPARAAIQYAGGTNVNAQCTASAGTKQELSDCIEDALNTAGWTTISGHHTSTVLVESLITPTAGLQMRMQMTQGTNCVVLKGRNVGNTRAQSVGMFLLPSIGKVFRVIADKYQAFISTDGTPVARSVAAFGVPYVPTFAGVTEAIWANGNGFNDTDTFLASTWKLCLSLISGNSNCGNANNAASNAWVTLNGTQWENSGAASVVDQPGFLGIVAPSSTSSRQGLPSFSRWIDGSYMISEPLIGWGATAYTGEGQLVGQLWDGGLITASIASETALTIDSHNWLSWTNSNSGVVNNNVRGTLILVVP